MITLIDRVCSGFDNIEAPEKMWRVFLEVLSEFQFEEIGYQVVPRTSNDGAKPILRSNQSEHPWVRRSKNENLYLRSPFIREAAYAGRTVEWTNVRKNMLRTHDREFVRDRDEAGISKRGITIPVFGPFNRDGFVSIGFGENTEPIDYVRQNYIQLLAQVVHQKIATLAGRSFTFSSQLSVRELEVVRLISYGLSNKQIAKELGVSPNTVQTFVRRAFEKLGVRDRVSAAREYLKIGYF